MATLTISSPCGMPYENGSHQSPVLTAYYFGGMYEVTGNDAKKYYSFAGQTAAARATKWYRGHLCQRNINKSSALFALRRREGNRGQISQTDYGYIGQRNLDSGIGLMDYRARFYSPCIMQFVQPDTLIPNPSNPQNWNRVLCEELPLTLMIQQGM